MAKYGVYSRRPAPKKRPWQVHPIWRGIGCLLILLVPALACSSAALLVRENQEQGWFAVPPELARPFTLPLFGPVDHFLALVVLSILLSAAVYILLTVLYSLAYRLFGPPPYGPMDAPPVRRRK